MTVLEMLRKPLSERLALTGTKQLKSFKLDDQEYTGYNGYSFFWEQTYVSEPERSMGGVVDLSSNAYFLTPHLKIDFSLISYDDFKRLRQQQLSKNTFQLLCWDTDNNEPLLREVYFHPATLPNFMTIARALNGEKWTEIIGAKNFVVELVGTNTDVEKTYIVYYVNKPSGATWGGSTQTSQIFSVNTSVVVGKQAYVDNGSNTSVRIPTITFNNTYKFKNWNTKPDGTGTAYTDNYARTLSSKIALYAQWTKT